MGEIGKTLADLLKSFFPYLQQHAWEIGLLIVVFCGLLLFLPDNALEAVHMNALRHTYSEQIGFAFSVSVVALVLALAWKTGKELKKQQNLGKLLANLPLSEKEYLRKYIDEKTQTQTFSNFDGVAASLVDKGILYRANSQANRAGEQDFNLTTWAYEHLNRHPEKIKTNEQHEKHR